MTTTGRPASVSSRHAAMELHNEMRAARRPPAAYGWLYEMVLAENLWPSQASLARDLAVAKSHITMAIGIHRLPAAVKVALGGPEKITYALARTVTRLMKVHGQQAIVERAEALARYRNLPSDRALAYLANGRMPSPKRVSIAVSFDAENECIKIESPDIYRLATLIPQIEATLCVLLGIAPPRAKKMTNPG